MLGTLLKGVVIGVLVSAPMGPIGILCIQRTLNKGRWHGFVTGLGAALSDVMYAILTSLGMGVVINFIEANQAPLQLLGSLVLAIFGYYIYKSNPVKALRKRKEGKTSYTQDFITAFLLTFSNVFIILLYIGLFARFSFILPDTSLFLVAVGIVCIGIGAVLWWFIITYFIAKLKKKFNVRGIWVLNRVIGSIIIALSLLGVLSVLLSEYINLPVLQI
ncbi:LysE family translocator [Parabacteroides pacaensis]|uniref:LysE family translocator n=1 Tax=Parabacteroides pacaensis TaxID=2086575 RepID=UPI000D0F8FD1|nr:LysE family translocator [Parabacteroides pacaensis]